ncbi:Gp138 family membrane-puncturing spike protein [Sulfurovum sp.]|uniref:Gp138 family membrane-puncturing spike protein n=1 Tax=Sulfurovum sp. TaxID=1969726 RepID=UPI003569F3A9
MLAISKSLANLHTCTIAKVTKVNAKTINCKPVTNRLVDGVSIELPEFVEVPLMTLQGGASYIHFPVAVGDYAMLIFTERCFDGWYNGQDNQLPLEHRMHDYSDGIAIVGINPFADAIDIPSVIQRTGDTNQDGDITHQGDRNQTGDVIHTGDKTQNGLFALTGNMTVVGDGGPGTANMTNITINIVTGDVIADGVSLKSHTHSGVQTGTGDTGVPN